MTDQPNRSTIVKVIVLGSANVGKTSLMKRYAHGKFSEERRVTTGADFSTKTIELGGQMVRIQIWDTAGQERFHAGTLGGPFYRNADGALIVYDVSEARSFEQVEKWRAELLSRLDSDPEQFPIIVVGNKMDTLGALDAKVTQWKKQTGDTEKAAVAGATAATALALAAQETRRATAQASPDGGNGCAGGGGGGVSGEHEGWQMGSPASPLLGSSLAEGGEEKSGENAVPPEGRPAISRANVGETRKQESEESESEEEALQHLQHLQSDYGGGSSSGGCDGGCGSGVTGGAGCGGVGWRQFGSSIALPGRPQAAGGGASEIIAAADLVGLVGVDSYKERVAADLEMDSQHRGHVSESGGGGAEASHHSHHYSHHSSSPPPSSSSHSSASSSHSSSASSSVAAAAAAAAAVQSSEAAAVAAGGGASLWAQGTSTRRDTKFRDPRVDREKVVQWCRALGLAHLETSAKDGSGVGAAMEAIAMQALIQRRRADEDEAAAAAAADGGGSVSSSKNSRTMLGYRGSTSGSDRMEGSTRRRRRRSSVDLKVSIDLGSM